MKWEKKGLIYCPKTEKKWNSYSFMTPSPILINSDLIRIYGGCRDKNGISRIGYIDVEASNPKKIIRISDKPCLDIGEPGSFDDNGVILGDVLKVKNKLYMYYVGFQLGVKVKFYAFSGLAQSSDNGETFTRVSESPIMDRTDRAKFIRAIHTVIYDEKEELFKIWYSIGNKWEIINNISYPCYDIWYTESKDGIDILNKDLNNCVKTEGTEYRIGRPKVYKTEFGYEMYYTRDLISKEYIIGYAVSKDGIKWERKDKENQILKSDEVAEWDGEMACYPALINVEEKTYAFYNGNGMGETGIGLVELLEE